MNFFDNVNEVFKTWNYNHPKMLWTLIRMLGIRVAVDLGTYRGLSASWMAKAMQENNAGRVFCIDRWSLVEHAHILEGKTPKQHAEENLTRLGVREWVEFIDGRSDEVQWPENPDLVYLDSWHSHEVAYFEILKAVQLGAQVIALDDTENCVGPRLLVDESVLHSASVAGPLSDYQRLDLHSDNGLTIFVKKQQRRLVTFSQELPYPNPGVDLRPLTLEQQAEHFKEASAITGLDYSSIMNQTEHDLKV